MHTQVHLSSLKLSILSIPREKAWLFSAPILRLLHDESRKIPESYPEGEEESDGTYPDLEFSDEDIDPLALSITSTGSASKRLLTPRSSVPVRLDNSSKQKTDTLSHEDLNELLSPFVRPSSSTDSEGNSDDEDDVFFHIAYTPHECTIICSTRVMENLFLKLLDVCKKLEYLDVILVLETFNILQVDSEGGFNNSARILELTRPLAAHKISLFFLSSHFSDIVLFPLHLREDVVRILAKQDFEFSDNSNSYIVNRTDEVNSPGPSSDQLESETLRLFREAGIKPKIASKTNLLLTGARAGKCRSSILKAAQCIASDRIPQYFAITQTYPNELSLVLPGIARKRAAMGFNFKSIIGSTLDTIVPITIDLTKLPLNSTGIVSGLASTLLNSVKDLPMALDGVFEMNYLSMARSAIVMIPEENLAVLSQALASLDL